MILGNSGKMIKMLAEETRQELANVFHCEVSLKLNYTDSKAIP